MATQVQFRGGTTTEHASFNGAAREVTVDTTKQTLVVQDGSTNGGFPLLGEKNADNVTVNFGTGDDLQIYHDGSNSYIKDTGTGDLFISGKNNIRFLDYGTNEDMAKMTSDGAVELFYDGGKKFETNVDGIEIYGNCLMDADNRKIILGASDDLQIYHDGSHSYIKDAGTGDLRILSSELNIQNAAGTETQAYFAEDGAVALYYDGSKKFETVSDGVKLAADNSTLYIGAGGDLRLWHNGTNSNLVNITGDLLVRSGGLHIQNAAGTETQAYFADDGAVDLYYDGSKKFETYAYGIKTTQNIMIGTHAYWEDSGEAIFGDDSDLKIYHSGADSVIDKTTDGNLLIYVHEDFYLKHGTEKMIAALDNGAVELYHDNSKKLETTTAGITVAGAVTETSDIALKTNIEPIDNVLDKIKQITGYTYQFKDTGHDSMGVTAQDVEKVFPELVHGKEGAKTLQYSGLIGALIESVKELSAKVAALESA